MPAGVRYHRRVLDVLERECRTAPTCPDRCMRRRASSVVLGALFATAASSAASKNGIVANVESSVLLVSIFSR